METNITNNAVSEVSLKRRPKSELRKQLEALTEGQSITVNYSGKKTPFAVVIAIKRQQLVKHFVFQELEAGVYKVWISASGERSHSLTGPGPKPKTEVPVVAATPAEPVTPPQAEQPAS